MANFAPDFCPYCGSELEDVDPPTVHHCPDCDDPVYHNAVLGGGAVVVDGDALLLVEDVRTPGAWTLPEGRPEIPESPREGVARELAEETGLRVDPVDLVYLYDDASQPVPDQHMVGVYYAVDRADTTGDLDAGTDAIDARFVTPAGFAASGQVLKDKHENPFWYPDLELLHDIAERALARGDGYAELAAEHLEN